MADEECYDGLATGGLIPHADERDILSDMGDYVIPASFAHLWGKALLDRLNEDVID